MTVMISLDILKDCFAFFPPLICLSMIDGAKMTKADSSGHWIRILHQLVFESDAVTFETAIVNH